MNEGLFKVGTSSVIICATYHRLIELSYANMEDTSEYLELIEKLKIYIKAENELYHNLSKGEVDNYFALINNKTIFNNSIDGRIYTRMTDIKRIYDSNPVIDGNILLSSVISSKLTIDILKNVEEKIAELYDNMEMNDDDINMLKLYSKRFKFYYLTTNYFIENLALNANFDVKKIPSYSYQDIENRFNIKFINNIQNNFYNYVITSLNELSLLKSENKYIMIYTKLFEVARIEAMLPYLNLDSLNKILSYITDHKIKCDSNSAIKKVKKIIIKRKEEFQ